MAEKLYDKIPEIRPIYHMKDFDDFVQNYRRIHEDLTRAVKMLKSEIKRLQDEKQDA